MCTNKAGKWCLFRPFGSLHEYAPHFFNHPNTFAVYDATEFPCEKSYSLEAQCQTWSEYKQDNTGKVNITTTPDGRLIQISNVYGGKASDRHIVEEENLLSIIPSGMKGMADKSYAVDDPAPKDIKPNS